MTDGPISTATKKEKEMGIQERMAVAFSSRAAVGIIAVALILGPFAQGAMAAPPIQESMASNVAVAFRTDCGTDQCTDTQVLLMVSDGTARACLDIVTYGMTTGLVGYETGCATLAGGGFSYDAKNLSGAAFPVTTIVMQEFVCGAGLCEPSGRPDRTTTVAASYTGVGLVSTFRANSKSTFGNCTMYFIGKGSSRQAEATVTIATQRLDLPGFLSTSSQKSKVICR
jgi:hypothetical protein